MDRQGAFITQPGRRGDQAEWWETGDEVTYAEWSSDWSPAILAEVCLEFYTELLTIVIWAAHSLTHVTQHLQSEELQEICSQGFLSPICHCQILRQGSRSHSYLVM